MSAPQRMGRFEVTDKLGQGAQGAVLRARDPATGQAIALKVLLRVDGRSERRFRQEAQVLAGLDHPTVVRVVDAGVDDGIPWLAMALIEGESFSARIAREGPLPPLAAARLVADLARGLQHCHERGIVHRDLKPDNVLVERASGRPVLVDFGLLRRDAEVFGELSIDARSRLSHTGELRGTPAYMAPEQVNPTKYGAVGPATDIYALGAVLFFLLTGDTVHQADSLPGLIARILEGQIDDVRARRPDVPAPLADVCRRALAQEPAQRFASAKDMAETLDQLVSPRGRAREGRRARSGVVVALLALALVALGVATAAWALRAPAVTSVPDTPATADVGPATELAVERPPRPAHTVRHTLRFAAFVRAIVVAGDLDGDGADELLVTQHVKDASRFDTRLVAVSGKEGRELWAHEGIYCHSGAAVVARPAAVLMPERARDGRAQLTWLDPRSGVVVRSSPLSELTTERWPCTPVLLDDGTVAVSVAPTDAARDGTDEVVALDALGERRWRITRAALEDGGGGEATGLVVAPFDADGDGKTDEVLWSAGATVSAVDPASAGDPLWSKRAEETRGRSPSLAPAPDGTALVITWTLRPGTELSCVAPGGKLRWRRTLAQNPHRPPVWVEVEPGRPADLLVFTKPADGVEDRGQELHLLDASTGATRKRAQVPESLAQPCRVRARDGRVFFACHVKEALTLLDADLRQVWTTPFSGLSWTWAHAADLDGDGDHELVLAQQGPGVVVTIDLAFPE